MSKKVKVLVIVMAVVSVFVGGTIALAATGNLGKTESAWLDFQKTLHKDMVDNGDMTSEEADEHLAIMQERFEESAEDDVYKRFSERGRGFGGNEGMGFRGEGGIVETYSEISGKEQSDIVEALREDEISIWKLAENDGNFDKLKLAELANIDERIKDLKEDRILEHLKEMRNEIAAMTNADDAPEQNGPRGNGGLGGGFKGIGGRSQG